jgi:predicted Zn-dependent peptidase
VRRPTTGRIRSIVLATVATCLVGGALRAQTPDRSKPPQPGPPPELHLPQIQKRQLSNGLPVWLVELHEVPVVQVNLLLRSGGADDGARRFGQANMTAAMLEQGAGSRTALQIADEVDYLGADLSAASGMDSSVVRLHVPVARVAEALPIMADIALRPTFPSEELDRVRQERLTSILQARDDPPAIASAAFARVLFGANHRYGTSLAGTAEVIKTFTTDDLKKYYSSAYRPDNATLIVTGDVTADLVLPLLESAFGSWKPPAEPITHAPTTPGQQPAGRTIYLIDKPGAPQSQIRIGDVGVARSSPDFFPLQVLNTILGGSFTSRLNNNLREVHGYAYGASSAFDMRIGGGLFFATAGVQTDKTSEALTEFIKELNGILKPVPADELERARNYVALRYPGAFETTTDMSRRLEDMRLFALPDDYFSKYVQNIQRVSAADVQRVAQKYILPNQVAVVVVGDRKTIEPGIRALNLGQIKIMTVDDVFGPKP